MRQAPFRPANEITQQYNSGIVGIYGVEDKALPGRLPAPGLNYKGTLRYEEMQLGLTRYYEGKQNQIEIERVIRTPYRNEVSTQDIAITEDGKQYRIDLQQLATGVYPQSMDLTLAKTEQAYEVPE